MPQAEDGLALPGQDKLVDVQVDTNGNEYNDKGDYYSDSDDMSWSSGVEDELDQMTLEEEQVIQPQLSPWKLMLLKNIDAAKEAQEMDKKPNKLPHAQKVFCSKPRFEVQSMKNTIQRTPTNRIGDAVVYDEDDEVGTLTNAAIDDKSSLNIVRTRGNRLTNKQAEIKAKRIKAKPNA